MQKGIWTRFTHRDPTPQHKNKPLQPTGMEGRGNPEEARGATLADQSPKIAVFWPWALFQIVVLKSLNSVNAHRGGVSGVGRARMGEVCGQAAWPNFGGTAHREEFCASQKGKNLEKK